MGSTPGRVVEQTEGGQHDLTAAVAAFADKRCHLVHPADKDTGVDPLLEFARTEAFKHIVRNDAAQSSGLETGRREYAQKDRRVATS